MASASIRPTLVKASSSAAIPFWSHPFASETALTSPLAQRSRRTFRQMVWELPVGVKSTNPAGPPGSAANLPPPASPLAKSLTAPAKNPQPHGSDLDAPTPSLWNCFSIELNPYGCYLPRYLMGKENS